MLLQGVIGGGKYVLMKIGDKFAEAEFWSLSYICFNYSLFQKQILGFQ